jgi:hypothetical protein
MISLDKLVNPNRLSLRSVLQQVRDTCKQNLDRWIRQYVIDNDPYEEYEREVLMQKLLHEAESRLLQSSDPECSDCHVKPVDSSPNSPPWVNSNLFLSLYLDLKKVSKSV